mgnify:CR=1 FL=1
MDKTILIGLYVFILPIFLIGCSSGVNVNCIDLAEEDCYQETINHYQNLSKDAFKFYEDCVRVEKLPIMSGGCVN